MVMLNKQAFLVLEDGSVFQGVSAGVDGETVGEIVFNTSMTGYQEILTDPSYCKQIVTFTYPHIGNTGVTPQDAETSTVWPSGLVLRDLTVQASSWRSKQNFPDYLKMHNMVAIAQIDTRRLTNVLRKKGALKGCIVAGHKDTINVDQALALAVACPSLLGMDLAQVVTTKNSYEWNEPLWSIEGDACVEANTSQYHVVVYDFGVKRNILRMLAARGCKMTVVPAKTSAEDVLALNPDGVFLSNGPGDPEPCDYAIAAITTLLKAQIPLFGICLGCQLLAMALKARTVKMKFGHHGANHPVQALDTKRVFITSQNHGFMIDDASLPDTIKVTHRSLFDGSIQGIVWQHGQAFGFQGHPEASPGPHDFSALFDNFMTIMRC